jgi:PEP-CTERM motif
LTVNCASIKLLSGHTKLNTMNTEKFLFATTLAGALLLPGLGSAATLYSQDFNAATLVTNGPTSFGGFGQINNVGGSGWQVQGGGGGSGISVTTGIDNTGVGSSQGFFANWDHSAATGFTFNQETVYGAIAAPGAGFGLAQIQISLDIFISGSETSTTPLGVALQNSTNEWNFTPTLVNGAYTHVVFTADQATPAGANGSPYNPTLSSNLRVQFGAGGFGFDANNIVTLDNILVTTVPEPTSLALVGLGAAGLVFLRRRRF